MYNICTSARTIRIYIERESKHGGKRRMGGIEKRSVLDRGKFVSFFSV